MQQNHPNIKESVTPKRLVIIADSISGLVLLLLLYTALSKLADPIAFKFLLTRSPLLKTFAGTIWWLLPVAEIVVVLLLFFTTTRLKGLYASFFLISIFTVYLGSMLLFSTDIPCSCGGVLNSLSWQQHIIFNLFFIILSAIGIVLHKKHKEAIQRTPP